MTNDETRKELEILTQNPFFAPNYRASALGFPSSLVIRHLDLHNGAPGGTCTHTLPADNGLLFFSATGAL